MRTAFLKAALLSGVIIAASAGSSYAMNVSIGGGGGSVASVSTGNAAGTSTTVNVGNTSGPLAAVNGNGSANNANVNLGGLRGNGQIANAVNGLLNGTNVPGPTTTPTPVQVADQIDGLSSSQRSALRMRCRDVLAGPGAFDAQLVALCRIIAKVR